MDERTCTFFKWNKMANDLTYLLVELRNDSTTSFTVRRLPLICKRQRNSRSNQQESRIGSLFLTKSFQNYTCQNSVKVWPKPRSRKESKLHPKSWCNFFTVISIRIFEPYNGNSNWPKSGRIWQVKYKAMILKIYKKNCSQLRLMIMNNIFIINPSSQQNFER